MSTISSRQLAFILMLSRITVVTLMVPGLTTADSLRDSWISALIAIPAALLVAGLSSRLLSSFPGKSLGDIANAILGRLGASLIALAYALLGLAFVVVRTKQLALLVNITSLPTTPLWVVSNLTLVGAFFYASLGVDTLGRAAEVLLTIVLFAVLATVGLLFSSQVTDASLLRPIMFRGMPEVLKGSVVPTFLLSSCGLYALVLNRHSDNPRQVSQVVSTSIIVSGLVHVILTFACLITIGGYEAQAQLAPLLALGRTIFFRAVLERLDVVLLNVWTLGMIFEVTLLFLFASGMLSDGMRLPRQPVLVGLALVAALTINTTRVTIFNIERIMSPLIDGILSAVFQIGIVLLVLCTSSPKKRKVN